MAQVDKFKKVFDLANGEATKQDLSTISEKYFEAVLKYHLNAKDITEESAGDVQILDVPMGLSQAQSCWWAIAVAKAVADMTFCISLYKRRYRQMTFIGREVDVQAAEALYGWLVPNMQRLAIADSLKAKKTSFHATEHRHEWLADMAINLQNLAAKLLKKSTDVEGGEPKVAKRVMGMQTIALNQNIAAQSKIKQKIVKRNDKWINVDGDVTYLDILPDEKGVKIGEGPKKEKAEKPVAKKTEKPAKKADPKPEPKKAEKPVAKKPVAKKPESKPVAKKK